MQWLLDQQPKFWKHEERRLHDRVLECRQELSRCKSMGIPGEVASCSEQKHALERTIAQLRHAEENRKMTKHWGRIIEHESHEWQGRANQFTTLLESDLPKAIRFWIAQSQPWRATCKPQPLAGSRCRDKELRPRGRLPRTRKIRSLLSQTNYPPVAARPTIHPLPRELPMRHADLYTGGGKLRDARK